MNMPALIESVAKVDDHTVKIGLTRPEAPFLANLAMSAIERASTAESSTIFRPESHRREWMR